MHTVYAKHTKLGGDTSSRCSEIASDGFYIQSLFHLHSNNFVFMVAISSVYA